MAVPANTVTKYDIGAAQGAREDLSDIIYDITPTDTPLLTMAGRGKAEQTLHEWLNDELEAASTTNANLDGDDSAAEAYTGPTRTGNYTQIFKKVFGVSGTAEAIRKAGRKSELARLTTRKGRALKRDIEATAFANIGASAGAAGTARTMAGLGAIVKTNVDKEATGTDPVYVGNLPTDPRNDGVQRAFSETILKSVVQKGYTNGMEMKVLSVGPFNKGVVSTFNGIATMTVEQTKAKPGIIVGSASVYVTEFGNLTVMPNRYQRDRDGWFLDPEYISFDYLRPFKVENLAKTGDSTKKHLIAELTLRVSNEKALGLAADLATS